MLKKLMESNTSSCFKIIMLHNVNLGRVKSEILTRRLAKENKETEKETKEKILVRKKWEKNFRYVEIDHNKNIDQLEKVKQMMNKNKVADVFFELETNVAKKNVRKFLKYKYVKNNTRTLYEKLNLLLSLKAIHGELFLLILIKKVELAKKIFVIEVEQGQAVYITNEIRQDDLPLSMRFYDPVLRIIFTGCSDTCKEFFALKNEFDINQIFQNNLWAKFTAKINGLSGDGKLTFKH